MHANLQNDFSNLDVANEYLQNKSVHLETETNILQNETYFLLASTRNLENLAKQQEDLAFAIQIKTSRLTNSTETLSYKIDNLEETSRVLQNATQNLHIMNDDLTSGKLFSI